MVVGRGEVGVYVGKAGGRGLWVPLGENKGGELERREPWRDRGGGMGNGAAPGEQGVNGERFGETWEEIGEEGGLG